MQTYTDDQFTALISTGAAPSAIIVAAGENVPFETLLDWSKSRHDLLQKIAAYSAEVKTLKEAAEWVISQDLALPSSQARSIFPE